MIVRELLVQLGVRSDGVQKAETGVNKLVSTMKRLGIAAAATAAAFKVSQLVDETTTAVDKLAKTSQKLGVGAQALGELRFAAERTGVSTQTLDLAMQRFIRRSAEASKGTGEAVKAFKELGITQKELEDSSPEDLLSRVSDGLANAKDSGTQLRLAFKLFDSEGAALVNTLKGGSEELEGLRKRFRDLGVDLSGETTSAMEEYRDLVLEADTASLGMRIELTKFLLPIFKALTAATRSLSQAFSFLTRDTKLLQAVLSLVAAVLVFLIGKFAAVAIASKIAAVGSLGAWLLSLFPLFVLISLITFVILLFEDLWTGIQGGESVLFDMADAVGELFDSFMSLRSTNPILDGLLQTIQTMAGQLQFAKEALFGLVSLLFGGTLKNVGGGLKQSFFDNLVQPLIRDERDPEEVFNNTIKTIKAQAAGIGELFGGQQQIQNQAANNTSTATTNNSTRTLSPISIQVNGAQDPSAVAREVDARLQATMNKTLSDTQRATAPRFDPAN